MDGASYFLFFLPSSFFFLAIPRINFRNLKYSDDNVLPSAIASCLFNEEGTNPAKMAVFLTEYYIDFMDFHYFN